MKRLRLTVCTAAVTAALAGAALLETRAAEAAPAPVAPTIFEGRGGADGETVLMLVGASVNKFKRFEITDVADVPIGAPTVVLRSGKSVVLLLPADLAPRRYRLRLGYGKADTLVQEFRLTGVGGTAGVALGDGEVSGTRSAAIGGGVTAAGTTSAAFGDRTTAGGASSFACGTQTTAAGPGSFAAGGGTTASGDRSAAFGIGTVASGQASFVAGDQSSATQYQSAAFGGGQATASYAFAINAIASGRYSFAMGPFCNASGEGSSAMGLFLDTRAYNAFSVGQFNVAYTGANPTVQVATDPLFQAGNGTSFTARSDAMVLFKNGNMTIAGTLTENSDARLKTDVQPLGEVLERLRNVHGVSYRFKDGVAAPAGRQVGLLAQDVQAAFPELVQSNANGTLSVAYGKLSAVLVEAVNEQQRTIDARDAEIRALREAVAKLGERLDAIEAGRGR